MAAKPKNLIFMAFVRVIESKKHWDGDEKDRLSEGDQVFIQGIITKREWNDQYGTVSGSYNEKRKRWPIKVTGVDKSVLLRSDCLSKVQWTMKEFDGLDNTLTHCIAKGVYNIDKDRCHVCYKKRNETGVVLRKCKKCYKLSKVNDYIPRYCSRKCQKYDWKKKHKGYCGKLYYEQ